MAQIPRSYLDNYTEALNEVTAKGQKTLSDLLSKIDYGGPTDVVQRGVLTAMDAACKACSQMSARVSAEFYDGLRERALGRALGAHIEDQREPVATERAVRAFLKHLFDGEYDEFERLCMERIDYEVKRAAGRCTQYNVDRDPYGETRYARVPTGEETCDFCIMLASRGPVYLTAESAGAYDHYHRGCDCRVLPVFGTYSIGPSRRAGYMSIEGYDPNALYDQYCQMMLNPNYASRMAHGADTAKGRTRGGAGTWADANAAGKTTFHNIHEVTTYLRDSPSYEDLCARMKEINKEIQYYGLSEKQVNQLIDLCKSVRSRELGI